MRVPANQVGGRGRSSLVVGEEELRDRLMFAISEGSEGFGFG